MTARSLTLIRRLGCTKVQMGIQTLDPAVARANNRACNPRQVKEAFALLRLFGFKIHAHFMVNLHGSSPADDLEGYRQFVSNPGYLPDEVKLYPCVLVDGTGLCARFADGSWTPYGEGELVDVLAQDTLATPPFMRISRMIRDISAHDIKAGSKKTNLRQMVESKVLASGEPVQEIRLREIATDEVSAEDLSLSVVSYATLATDEHFLQWVTPEGKIAGFLRLSLPHPEAVAALADAALAETALAPERDGASRDESNHAASTASAGTPERHGAGARAPFPLKPGEAMIREVHVYGRVAKLHETGFGSQHLGLGKQLVERACDIARKAGYDRINVISAIGTREYYRNLNFKDNGLYQQRDLS